MIDNYSTTTDLLKALENALPIATTPTKRLISNLKEQNIKIKSTDDIKIARVMYMGDDGGICCEIQIPGTKNKLVIVSLTHLTLNSSHPLYKPVKTYQLERIKKLAAQKLSQFKA